MIATVPSPTAREAAAVATLAHRAIELQPAAANPVPVQIDELLQAGMRGCTRARNAESILTDEQLLGVAARLMQLGSLAGAAALSYLSALDSRITMVVPVPRPPDDAGAISGDGPPLWLQPNTTPGPAPYSEPTCRGCGCTERNACHTAAGVACSWHRLDALTNVGTCTACVVLE